MELENIDFRIWLNVDKMYLTLNTEIDFPHEYGIMKTNKGKMYVIYKCNGETDKYAHAQIEFWTGIKDLDGKKIYEGDIVEVSNPYNRYKAIVKRHKEGTFYLANADEKSYIGALLYSQEQGDKIQVVGNIKKNPELLGGGE